MKKEDKRAIRKLYNNNFSKKYIRSLFKISIDELNEILDIEQYSRFNKERAGQIYFTKIAYDLNYTQLGIKFNLSRQAVTKIVKKYEKRHVDNFS